MIANLGFGALVIAFILSLYGIGAAIYGAKNQSVKWVESARLSMLLTFPLIAAAALSLIYLLVNHQFQFEYVASVTSRSMPLYLRITALWGGQAGSLIFWSLLMSAFASAVTLRKWDRDAEFLPWVIVVSLVTLAFFLLETYELKSEDILSVYKFLLSKEDDSITTVEDFYNNSKLITSASSLGSIRLCTWLTLVSPKALTT